MSPGHYHIMMCCISIDSLVGAIMIVGPSHMGLSLQIQDIDLDLMSLKKFDHRVSKLVRATWDTSFDSSGQWF